LEPLHYPHTMCLPPGYVPACYQRQIRSRYGRRGIQIFRSCGRAVQWTPMDISATSTLLGAVLSWTANVSFGRLSGRDWNIWIPSNPAQYSTSLDTTSASITALCVFAVQRRVFHPEPVPKEGPRRYVAKGANPASELGSSVNHTSCIFFLYFRIGQSVSDAI
jgi:hypothetical protein